MERECFEIEMEERVIIDEKCSTKGPKMCPE